MHYYTPVLGPFSARPTIARTSSELYGVIGSLLVGIGAAFVPEGVHGTVLPVACDCPVASSENAVRKKVLTCNQSCPLPDTLSKPDPEHMTVSRTQSM